MFPRWHHHSSCCVSLDDLDYHWLISTRRFYIYSMLDEIWSNESYLFVISHNLQRVNFWYHWYRLHVWVQSSIYHGDNLTALCTWAPLGLFLKHSLQDCQRPPELALEDREIPWTWWFEQQILLIPEIDFVEIFALCNFDLDIPTPGDLDHPRAATFSRMTTTSGDAWAQQGLGAMCPSLGSVAMTSRVFRKKKGSDD